MQHLYSALLAAALLPAQPVLAAATGGTHPRHAAAKRKASALPDPNTKPVGGIVSTVKGETLPGATVFIKGTYVGTSTNQVGEFSLNTVFDKGPVTLVVAYVGYETQEYKLEGPDSALRFNLVPSVTLLNETVVSASRVEENILRAPVTIDKISGKQLERISTPEVLAGLGQLAGVDVNSASMLFTSVSTRGFNTAKSERVIQLVDYMDTALPSLNLSPGNLVGIPELDMESIEIIHGPASALYGSNALSGVVLFNSKDPFVYEGLSARLRGGERNLLDGQVRYAKKLGNKFAIKLNGSYFEAKDWIANNFERANTSRNLEGSTLGYDAVNRYGELDFRFQSFPGFTAHPELVGKTVYLPGYTEQELIAGDQKTRSYRVQGAVSYLIKDDLKLTAEAKRGVGTSTYQNLSRFRIKDLGTNQYRLELKGSNGFLRAYSTEDFTGSSYELTQLAGQLGKAPTTEGGTLSYQNQYIGTYNQAYGFARSPMFPGGALGPEAAQGFAQTTANGTLLKSTDPRFATLRDKIANDDQPGSGAQQNFNSFLNDVSGQRSFHLSDFGTDLIVGAAYREYRLGSGGKLFADNNGERIRNYEYGGYAQLIQTFIDARLKFAFAGRLDNFKNFKSAFSPRAAAVYSAGANKQHNFRASYGQAFRSPSNTDQYLQSDVNTFILLGNIGNGFQGYGFANAQGQEYRPGVTPIAGFEVSFDKLRLERVNTIEVGYKGAIIPNVYVDASYFRSRYNDFIGGSAFVGKLDGTRPSEQEVIASARANFAPGSPARIIYTSHNNQQVVRTQGAVFGVTYYLNKALNLSGNYSLNVLDRSNLASDFRTFFNTPKHKFNIGASGIALRNFTYSVNYRWVEGHDQEMPFAAGRIRSYRTTDAYLGYTAPKLMTTFQAGVSNLFDANNIQIIGGPQIGRLAYLGLLFNVN